MSDPSNRRLTAAERTTHLFLQYAPWLAFLLIALPAPFYFLLRYFQAGSGADAGEFMLLAMTTLAAGSILGLLVVVGLFIYRRLWEQRLRHRLAADGVATGELLWFMNELTKAERRTLREIEGRNPLLAEAYRETLASRLTATRLIAHTKREALAVERRTQAATRLPVAERASLEVELTGDRARLSRIEAEATEQNAQAEARLLMIEAAASRNSSDEETRVALQRLQLSRAQVPHSLEHARLEREAREEIERELHDGERPVPGESKTN